jgi:hypothetical protein
MGALKMPAPKSSKDTIKETQALDIWAEGEQAQK